MSLNSVLNRGLDGLTVNLRGLAVASNNIANVNTRGYERQEIQIGARLSDERVGVGGGASILGVRSIMNPFVEMQLFTTGNDFGTIDGRKKAIDHLETVFNETGNNGLASLITGFFNKMSELSTDPSNSSLRISVRESGRTMIDKFNILSDQLNEMRSNLSSDISKRLSTINNLANQIAQANQAVQTAGGSLNAPGLVSQRRQLLKDLSQEVNITFYELDTGVINVQVAGTTPLIAGFTAGALSLVDNLGAGGTATVRIQIPGTTDTADITSRITGGRLAGNLTERNTTLNDNVTSLDTLAYQLATQFNTLHATGYGLAGTTGNNFFATLASSASAAKNIALAAAITTDVRNIAAASQNPVTTSGVGDNRMALQLANLQNSLVMNANTQTFSQYYQGLVGQVGVTARAMDRDYEIQSQLLNQIEMQRETISGVNMDEEGANLIRFERAFQAASRVILIADEMMEYILRI